MYNTWENPNEPYDGTDEERKEYVKSFNNKLKDLCEQNNYVFIEFTSERSNDHSEVFAEILCDIKKYLPR